MVCGLFSGCADERTLEPPHDPRAITLSFYDPEPLFTTPSALLDLPAVDLGVDAAADVTSVAEAVVVMINDGELGWPPASLSASDSGRVVELVTTWPVAQPNILSPRLKWSDFQFGPEHALLLGSGDEVWAAVIGPQDGTWQLTPARGADGWNILLKKTQWTSESFQGALIMAPSSEELWAIIAYDGNYWSSPIDFDPPWPRRKVHGEHLKEWWFYPLGEALQLPDT